MLNINYIEQKQDQRNNHINLIIFKSKSLIDFITWFFVIQFGIYSDEILNTTQT